jgi:hypothetical protein
MAAKKKTTPKPPTGKGKPKSTVGKGKPNLTYDSHRNEYSDIGIGPVGNRRGRRNPGTYERVSGNRIHSKNQMVTEAWAGGGPAWEVWNMKTSDALVTPTVNKKKAAPKKSATKKR